MNKTEQHKKAIIKALENSLGVVTDACKKVGVGRTTFYDWLNNDPEFKKEVESITDYAIDYVESKLYNLIEKEDTTATIFYLKTKGRKRGYSEKIITENINYNSKELNENEIKKINDTLENKY